MIEDPPTRADADMAGRRSIDATTAGSAAA
jgi:hypothetical protein